MRFVPMCLAGFVAVATVGGVSLSVASSAPPPSTLLIVSTTADAINGDVSSPAALIAHPGPDGISLREAILAANHATGLETVTFAPALAGTTITPKTNLPALSRDDATLAGLMSADGQPSVTLDGKNTSGEGLVVVHASKVTVSHLHLVDVNGYEGAIAVHAGVSLGELGITGDRIESNVLENNGRNGVGMTVGVQGAYPGVQGASVRDLTIAHNVVRGFTGDGINAGLSGASCAITGLVIEDNTFANNTGSGNPTLELAALYSTSSIVGTRIARNTFTGNWNAIGLNAGVDTTNPSSGNVVSGTVISQNVFAGNQLAISIGGGAASASSTGNTILNTEISNNVFVQNEPFGAITIEGGGQGANGNRVDGVSITNDTVAFNGNALALFNSSQASTTTQISNVAVLNTVFWMNDREVFGSAASAVLPSVSKSLIDVDPHFISAQDPHLQAGSPAINAGATGGAPAVDLDDAVRDTAPDIGAYEFGAAPRPRLEVDVEERGGAGTVSSSPAGIVCGMICDAVFDEHTAVTLSAAPAAGSRFVGWSGACSGTRVCTPTLVDVTTVSAIFSASEAMAPPRPVKVTVAVKGKGRVTGGAISCPARCTTTIASGAKLTLRANPAHGYRFAGWSGACKGLRACVLHPNVAVRVTAAFRRSHS